MSEDPFEDIEKMLSTLFGAQVAGDAVAALRSSGIDPTQLAQMSGVDMSRITPVQLLAVQEQMQRMMKDGQEGPVNWTMGRDLALQGARRGGDPAITASDAEATRQALRVADLWLDAATDFMPAPGEREAWSRTEWVERTLPVWQDVCSPVADAATATLATVLESQIGSLPASDQESGAAARQVGALTQVMRSMAGTAFGLQVGHAVGELAGQAVAATDVGLPLTREPGTALVSANVKAFADGLEIDVEQVRMFLAVREAAAARLYAHVPWLRPAAGRRRGLCARDWDRCRCYRGRRRAGGPLRPGGDSLRAGVRRVLPSADARPGRSAGEAGDAAGLGGGQG